MTRPAIEIHDLTVAYREKPVLWDIDAVIPVGSLCAIVGPNGAGKSTLLSAILGTIRPASGWLKEEACLNMKYMAVTLLTSHASDWSKTVAPLNMETMLVTLLTSHASG